MFTDFLKQAQPAELPSLDKEFVPAVLFYKAYEELCEQQTIVMAQWALRRGDQQVQTGELKILSSTDYDELTKALLRIHFRFLLWAGGGYELLWAGPEKWGRFLQTDFAPDGYLKFDSAFMERVYGKSFSVTLVEAKAMPKAESFSQPIGGHLDGCRIGFDLGASDYKIAAIQDGEPIFTTEIRWDPVPQKDPSYHVKRITEGLELAASHLPKVDAIGGSSAGIINNNQIRVASLFRSVSEEDFQKTVSPLFDRLKEMWQVPFIAINDGDVSALAGFLSTQQKGLLGIAMGSSEAVGFLNDEGEITGQLNELAFAPIDFNPKAPIDEWSNGVGAGVMYFSQQAVNRLALKLGMEFSEDQLLPERLKVVQAQMNAGDKEVAKIFQTIGVYLGYTLPFYHRFYKFKKVMVFGRVMSGKGGDCILATAKEILAKHFADLKIQVEIPDEKFRRVGQAVAAASLPPLGSRRG